MAKVLIYMGKVPSGKHRIALFDPENILVKKLPVKDVDSLPENVAYLNCTVKAGVAIPNLKGAKVLRIAAKGEDAPFQQGRKGLTYKDLWLDKNKKPDYLYGQSESNYDDDYFYSGWLLGGLGSGGWAVWDGNCTENTCYHIAALVVKKSGKRDMATPAILALTSTGELFFTSSKDVTILVNSGMSCVQVGTPELRVQSAYSGSRCITDKVALVRLKDADLDKLIWQGRNKLENTDEAEQVWWNPQYRTTICDLRKFKRAHTFGVNSISDASVIVFPEGVKDIWLGLLRTCSSLKAVYIPRDLEYLREYLVPSRKVKQVKFYSSSPLVVDFCARYGAECVPCEDAEVMLADFYSASDEDYISITDANSIASLAGNLSDKAGATGAVWSAALFSLSSTGMADETLEERYPVVDTSKGWYEAPKRNIRNMPVGSGTCEGHGVYGKQRTRTLAGALTQFYPSSDRLYDVPNSEVVYDKFKLGDYTLYIGVNAFNSALFYNKPAPVNPNVYRTSSQKKADKKKESGDDFAMNHVALLVNASGDVIHRFECGTILRAVLANIEGSSYSDEVPTGVLRYADKLPAMHNWLMSGSNYSEHTKVLYSLFRSFLIVSYGTRLGRRQAVGIDLHTGAFATLEYTVNSYSNVVTTGGRVRDTFALMNRITNIKLHPMDADLSALFSPNCVYNKDGVK